MSDMIHNRGTLVGPIARLETLLSSIPAALPVLALRVALAVPFFKSGLTKWDGFLQLSGGARYLFTQEFRLHILRSPVPLPVSAHHGDACRHQ